MMGSSWQQKELLLLVLYAIIFYTIVIRRSLQLSHDHDAKLYGLHPGWIGSLPNDASDAQWRNFRGNLPTLTMVFVIFTLVAKVLRSSFSLEAKGMSVVWTMISLAYLSYLHGACIMFIIAIASANFFLVKMFGRTKYFSLVLWIFNLSFLVCNRIYEGYKFSSFGQHWAFLDYFRGTFRWHICFNFVVLRMISFGYDYHWTDENTRFDRKKHVQNCDHCSSGKTCYLILQEKRVTSDKFSFPIYLCYLVYAPLYIAGPIISFNAFASQLDSPQSIYSTPDVAWYGFRWGFSLLLMELMTHLFHYNAFAISRLWKQLSPMDIFIIGYGVLNFMWLKFFLIWRYFRFWSMVNGIVAPENMPRCVNNCHNLESFWKNWHASFNRWLVRYVYIPLGGSQTKLLNVWAVFTFVAVWHDLEWKLLSWAWLTCIFFIPEMLVKSAAAAFPVEGAFWEFVFRELRAVAGAITITCLMVANLVGFVIGPSGINWLVSGFLQKEGLPTLFALLVSFYVGTKLMFHISDAKQIRRQDRTR
ncbi:MBOAT (membrane bound O-acyl transferase) family protein [Striga hermonthica]|uniref:MBOAT (Membrane bound O-acyl transferase) family protein n=1 Tax=Striga hermonthica TaxID=68872 RepID=A0A9N7N3C9_STRHE|nr:MBOAT (membrane bound O-acyl transferase) family protein [Striga hermonthica]